MNLLRLIVLTFVLSSVAHARVPAKTEVLIIGAGLSGLATAYELKKAGIPFHVIELSPRIGGRVRTVKYQLPGQSVLHADSGMEEYWESNPAVKILRELKLPVRTELAASSMVLSQKLEVLKSGETSEGYLARIFSPSERLALEGFKTKVAPLLARISDSRPIPEDLLKLKDIAFSDWVLQQALPKRVSEWIRISIECEIGTGWNKLSALDGIAEFHIFMGKGEKSYRVVGGNEKFTDALASAIGRDQITLNERVTRLVTRNGKVTVTYLDQVTNRESTVEAHHVVSTIPLYRLSELQFDPPLSNKKWQAISTQSWGAYFKAHVFISDQAKNFSIKRELSSMPILSDSELGVIYDGNPDQNGRAKIISLLITGDHAEAFNMMPLDRVKTRILASFDQLWPGFASEVTAVEFYRFHPRAIAGWPVGRSRFDDLSDAIRKPENQIYLSGDFTEGTHSSGAFESALRVAKSIIAQARRRK